MEFSEKEYQGFSWKIPPFQVQKDDPIFSTEPIIDLLGVSAETMREQERQKRKKFDEIYLKIRDRYDFENRWHKYYASNYRENYTPAQKRRIRKQTNKWRKRLLGEYY